MLRFFFARFFPEIPPGSEINQHPEAFTACLPGLPIPECFLHLPRRTCRKMPRVRR